MSSMDVEVLAENWRKASRSVGNGACVEAASADGRVLVRDSVNTSGAVIAYAPEAWLGFIASTKAGGFASRLEATQAWRDATMPLVRMASRIACRSRSGCFNFPRRSPKARAVQAPCRRHGQA